MKDCTRWSVPMMGLALASCALFTGAAWAQPANDDCLNAITLTLPQQVTGDTTLATNDTPEPPACGITSVLNQGVWYKVTGTGNEIRVSTCASTAAGDTLGDSMISVYDDCNYTTCITGNDDFCGLYSQVQFPSTLGQDYLIYVGGFGSNAGTFTLDVSEIAPCIFECIDTEGEPICGPDYDDQYNGGCNSTTPVFGSIQCGETVCGYTGLFTFGTSTYRDTDWYVATLAAQGILSVDVYSEVAVLAGWNEQITPGLVDCTNFTGYIAPFAITEPCVTTTLATECTVAGDYCFFVGADFNSGAVCGDSQYEITLSCLPCGTGACCLPDESCVVLDQIACEGQSGDYLGDGVVCEPLICAPCVDCVDTEGEPVCGPEYDDQYNGGCNSTPEVFTNIQCGVAVCGATGIFSFQGSNYRDTDWYLFTLAQDSVVTMDLTSLEPVAFGFIEAITPGIFACDAITGYINPFAVSVACELTTVTTDCLPAGEYCLFVGADFGSGTAECGDQYEFLLTCTPGCTAPAGACCLPDMTCQGPMTAPACAALGGFWQGDGTVCDPNPCAFPTGACCDGPTCSEPVMQWVCEAGGGLYIGDGTTCDPNPCPQPFAEDCENAILIDSLPYTYIFNNDLATADGPDATCDKFYPTSTGVMQNDAWWVVFIEEDCLMTIDVSSTYDTVIAVRDDCGALTELACDDTGGFGEPDQLIFGATGGNLYFIQIGDTGSFETGGLTNLSITCEVPTDGACCLSDGSCVILDQVACLAEEGAVYFGGSCDPNPCPEPTYCESTATSSIDSICGEVTLNTISNNTDGVCAQYSDFTALSTSLSPGASYDISILLSTCGNNYGKGTKAWIDYNQNYLFDAGELLTEFLAPDALPVTHTANFTVPGDAVLGETRLRVIVMETSSLLNILPCGTYSWGETEDYTVVIGADRCPEDLADPVGVEQQDLNAVLNRWGDPDCDPGGLFFPCPEDLAVPDGVEQQDLNAVLNAWGDPACE